MTSSARKKRHNQHIMSADFNPLLVLPDAQSNVLSVRAKAMIFADPASQQLLRQVEQFAPSEITILVTGDTGTGKELIARHIHACSGRKGSFVAVNCGALSQTLAEAELFGHQAGAFTGATETRAGWFESADKGTLFLDEIGDLPLSLQVKLLRVIQEREVVRVGARKPIALDVRIIAATNIDVPAAVEAGSFRSDLYYRLNVVTLAVPPLAQRPGDILPLAEHFLQQYSQRLGTRTALLLPETQQALLSHNWPGNIRELENVIHAGLLTARDGIIRPENLRLVAATNTIRLAPIVSTAVRPHNGQTGFESMAATINQLLSAGEPALHQRIEKQLVELAYAATQSNQVHTARLLGVSRNTLRTLLKRHGLLTDASRDAYEDSFNLPI
jgi:sigma-54-specific transcriptional regulator